MYNALDEWEGQDAYELGMPRHPNQRLQKSNKNIIFMLHNETRDFKNEFHLHFKIQLASDSTANY